MLTPKRRKHGTPDFDADCHALAPSAWACLDMHITKLQTLNSKYKQQRDEHAYAWKAKAWHPAVTQILLLIRHQDRLRLHAGG
jgi:hypothetical protein